jgi:hypothetical protein
MKLLIQSTLLALLCTSFALAQNRPDPNVPQGENLQVPEGWEIRLDRNMEDVTIGSDPDSSDIYFVNMTPGWHITSGPAGIYYHPSNTASDEYEVTAVLHLFDPGERNREAFGIFVGGENLDNDQQSYLYFLIRNTGEFLIKKRMGSETEVIMNWTPNDSINIYTDDLEDSSAQNTLSVSVSGSDIMFHINDSEVASVPGDNYSTDGLYGLRVNHSINLHISDLAYSSLD